MRDRLATISPRLLVGGLLGNHLARTTVLITLLSLIGKAIAAGREVAVARRFGVGPDVDAFILAFAVTSIAASVLGGAITTSITPAFIHVHRAEGAHSARQLAGRVLNLYVLAAVAVGVLLVALAPVVSVTFRDDAGGRTSLVVKCIVLLAGPTLLAGGLSYYLSALLNANRYFAVAALSPAIVPLTMLAVLLSQPAFKDISRLAVAAGAGFALQLVILAWASWRRGVLPILSFRTRHRGAADVMRQCFPAALASVVIAANPLVDMIFAARLGAGNVSVFGYGSRLVAVLLSVLGYAFATTSLPHLSRLAATGDSSGLRRACRRLAGGSLFITVPITLLLIVASRPIVDVLYRGGAFTDADADVVSRVQALYVLHLPVFVIGLIFVRLINSLKGNRSLILIAVPAVLVNVSADLVLGKLLGVAGIALATSVVYTFTSVLAYVIARNLLSDRRQVEPLGAYPLSPPRADTDAATVP